jgi:hypothetical protein
MWASRHSEAEFGMQAGKIMLLDQKTIDAKLTV